MNAQLAWLAGRLGRGSGRGEAVRFGLVVFGGALAAVLLLSAALVSVIRGGNCQQGCTRGQLYRTDLLDQAGLRPGVVTALLLMVIPVLVFLGMCARISAAQRDRRLAAIRLAGGTPGQVRLLAAADTSAPAALGALLGLLAFLIAKALLERSYLRDTDELLDTAAAAGPGSALHDNALSPLRAARALPTDVPVPVGRSLLVVLLVPALCAASAVLALRQVQITPLGIVRRTRPRPRATALLTLAAGLVVLAAAPVTGGLVLPVLAVGAALVILALAACGSWLAARTGALTARRTGRPALLLAGRRLQADPHGQGRALSGVVLAVLVASGASVLRSATLTQQAGDDGFYRGAYDLVDLALLIALVVAAAGLLVASCESVQERRQTLASLQAAGVPLAVLRRALLLQALLPAVPAVLLAATAGGPVGQLFAGVIGGLTFPWPRLLAVLAIALAAICLSTVLTLPLLRRSAQPAELRQT